MKGQIIALLLFGTFFVWLVGSYLLPDVLFWRLIPSAGLTPLFRVALVVSALLFVVIQIILVVSAFNLPQRDHRRDDLSLADDAQNMEGAREIVVERRWEVLWTAVPLVVSVGLFIVSYCALVG